MRRFGASLHPKAACESLNQRHVWATGAKSPAPSIYKNYTVRYAKRVSGAGKVQTECNRDFQKSCCRNITLAKQAHAKPPALAILAETKKSPAEAGQVGFTGGINKQATADGGASQGRCRQFPDDSRHRPADDRRRLAPFTHKERPRRAPGRRRRP